MRLQRGGCASSMREWRWWVRLTCSSRLDTLRPASAWRFPLGSAAHPNWQKGCSVPSDVLLSDKSWGEGEGRGNICGYGICIPIPEPPPGVLRLSFLGSGWTPACQWKAVNQFLLPLCLGTQLFLSILKCHFLHPQLSSPSLNLLCILWERVLSWVQAWLLGSVGKVRFLVPLAEQVTKVSADCPVLNTQGSKLFGVW